jgi:hypothetical protein
MEGGIVCRNSLIARIFSVQYFCLFIFVGIFDRELLTPLEVHYYTKDIFIGLITEAQRKALQEDPCPGLNWGPSLGRLAR